MKLSACLKLAVPLGEQIDGIVFGKFIMLLQKIDLSKGLHF